MLDAWRRAAAPLAGRSRSSAPSTRAPARTTCRRSPATTSLAKTQQRLALGILRDDHYTGRTSTARRRAARCLDDSAATACAVATDAADRIRRARAGRTAGTASAEIAVAAHACADRHRRLRIAACAARAALNREIANRSGRRTAKTRIEIRRWSSPARARAPAAIGDAQRADAGRATAGRHRRTRAAIAAGTDRDRLAGTDLRRGRKLLAVAAGPAARTAGQEGRRAGGRAATTTATDALDQAMRHAGRWGVGARRGEHLIIEDAARRRRSGVPGGAIPDPVLKNLAGGRRVGKVERHHAYSVMITTPAAPAPPADAVVALAKPPPPPPP